MVSSISLFVMLFRHPTREGGLLAIGYCSAGSSHILSRLTTGEVHPDPCARVVSSWASSGCIFVVEGNEVGFWKVPPSFSPANSGDRRSLSDDLH